MGSSTNKVDGIKKLNREELEKSRKLVLDSIGENKKREAAAGSGPVLTSATVDGIKEPNTAILPSASTVSRKDMPRPEKAPEVKVYAPKPRKRWQEEIQKIISPAVPRGNTDIPADNLLHPHELPAEVTARQPERKSGKEMPIKTSSANPEPDTKNAPNETKSKSAQIDSVSHINPFQHPLVAEKIQHEEENKKKILEQEKQEQEAKEREEKRQAREDKKARQAKEREEKRRAQAKEEARKTKERERLAEQERRKKEKAIKQKTRAERRTKSREKFRKTLNGIKEGSLFFLHHLRHNFKKAFSLLLACITLFIFLYTILVIVILEYRFDNKILRQINSFVPIPALITPQGIIDYYTYEDIRSAIVDTTSDPENIDRDAKVAVIKNLLVEDLAARYGIAGQLAGKVDDKIASTLLPYVIRDQAINQVGIKRIGKIFDLINTGNDFAAVANRYGDEQGQLNITAGNKDQYDFYGQISGLQKNDFSQIVYNDDGYYIFRCYDRRGDNLYLSYVMVKARNLDNYLNDAILNYRMWSLVD